jgi:acetyl-CoA synthetase
MSTAEVEAALMGHLSVAEAAVVSRPHKVKGECLYCFVSLKDHLEFTPSLEGELKRLGEGTGWGGRNRYLLGRVALVRSLELYWFEWLEIWSDLPLCVFSFPVREKIGPIATPDFIQNAPALPKTRSGRFSHE